MNFANFSKSIYGFTKLASRSLIKNFFISASKIRFLINRFSVIRLLASNDQGSSIYLYGVF